MPRASNLRHAVVYGDTHIPFQDEGALDVVKHIVKDVKPDVLIHIGDLIDCWSISRFDKDPTRRDTLQDNIDQSAEHLLEMMTLAPRAKRFYIEGNHEYRLSKVIQRMPEPQRELARLRVFQQHVAWPHILADAGVTPADWTFIPTLRQAHNAIFPKMVIKHGSIVRRWSGYSARAEWEKYGQSGMSGHTHRLGVIYHRDYNGAHGWAETGCTCQLDAEYCEDPDWQHGCVVVTFRHDYRYFVFEPVYIQEGHAIWRDNRYVP